MTLSDVHQAAASASGGKLTFLIVFAVIAAVILVLRLKYAPPWWLRRLRARRLRRQREQEQQRHDRATNGSRPDEARGDS